MSIAVLALARPFGPDLRQITGLIASCNPLKQNHIECPEFRRTLALDRCSFLKSSVLGFAGLALPDLLRADFSGRPRSALPPEETSQELF